MGLVDQWWWWCVLVRVWLCWVCEWGHFDEGLRPPLLTHAPF